MIEGRVKRMAIDIFLSVGRTSIPQHEEFVKGVEDYLRLHGMNPRTVGRNTFHSTQPLQCVRELMEQCSGTVIIAFERLHIERGLERRDTPIMGINLPTVWNQIEAAMAYLHNHPLLVIVERGLKNEGLLEKGYDWYVQTIDLKLTALSTTEFIGIFTDWKERVGQHKRRNPALGNTNTAGVSPDKLTVGQIMASLTMPQVWAIVIAVVTALGGVAALAYKIGSVAH
jgi:hypothetical protein